MLCNGGNTALHNKLNRIDRSALIRDQGTRIERSSGKVIDYNREREEKVVQQRALVDSAVEVQSKFLNEFRKKVQKYKGT